jgi:hypothetical protein
VTADRYVDPDVRCFACDRRYAYVGSEPWSARCGRCGSAAVSLAPPFEATGAAVATPDGGDTTTPVLRVTGTDATDRTVRYYLVRSGAVTEVAPVGVRLAGTLVDADESVASLTTPGLRRAVRSRGFSFDPTVRSMPPDG